MSDTGTPAEPTIIEQDGAIPETFTPAEHVEETVEPIEAQPEAIETPAPEAEPAKQKRTPWYQVRFNQLAEQRDIEKAEKQKLADRLAALEAQNPEFQQPQTAPALSEADIERIVQQRMVQREVSGRTNSMIEAGNKEFGPSEFLEKCNIVAAMGAGDSKEFMQIVTDPKVLPDGHKVVALLAENPDEAQEILALEPFKMAAALTRFAMQIKPVEKPISNAPKPISTTGGTARASAPADNDDIKAWMAKRNEQAWDRKPR